MTVLKIFFIIFLVLESLNILTLYFAPGSKKGNGVGTFNAWEKSKSDPEVHQLVKYMTYWVAGSKIIFVGLIIVIIITGSPTTHLWASVVMVIAIATFFCRLLPIIRKMDQDNQITPKGYSKTLAIMIAAFIAMFVIGILITLIF